MSGLYIRGLEMPDHCINCPFMVSREDDDCILQSAQANAVCESWEDMRNGCPLIPVPDHGRLIEEDAAYDKIAEEAHEDAGNYVDMDVVGRGLEYTPTIIPADESDMDSFIRILKD